MIYANQLPTESLPNIENTLSVKNDTHHESIPWSNSSPSGEDVPVLRACLPSQPSVDILIFKNKI